MRNLTNYGAFVEIEEGIDGLLHVSDMSWTKKVAHPSEMVKKGDSVECVVLSVDQEKKRIALGMKQLAEDPWDRRDPRAATTSARTSTGEVTKITNFGVFVELEEDLEGLLHISELADDKVDNPEEVVSVGDKVKVKVIKVDTEERKIGLTLLEVTEPAPQSEKQEETPRPRPRLRKGKGRERGNRSQPGIPTPRPAERERGLRSRSPSRRPARTLQARRGDSRPSRIALSSLGVLGGLRRVRLGAQEAVRRRLGSPPEEGGGGGVRRGRPRGRRSRRSTRRSRRCRRPSSTATTSAPSSSPTRC